MSSSDKRADSGLRDVSGQNELSWSHKDLWIQRAPAFAVEVSRHGEPLSDISPELGENRWCVYAYIYPKHPRFEKFDGTESFFQAACQELPLHGGVISRASYLRYHYAKDGTILSVQVGGDYNHLGDDRFTHLAPEDAGEIFGDAQSLFGFLSEEACSVPDGNDSSGAVSVSKEKGR